MARIQYETRTSLPPTLQFAAAPGLVTVEDSGGDTVRFILERQRITGNNSFAVDADEFVPRSMLPVLLENCREVGRFD